VSLSLTLLLMNIRKLLPSKRQRGDGEMQMDWEGHQQQQQHQQQQLGNNNNKEADRCIAHSLTAHSYRSFYIQISVLLQNVASRNVNIT